MSLLFCRLCPLCGARYLIPVVMLSISFIVAEVPSIRLSGIHRNSCCRGRLTGCYSIRHWLRGSYAVGNVCSRRVIVNNRWDICLSSFGWRGKRISWWDSRLAVAIDCQECGLGRNNVRTTRSGLRERLHLGWFKADACRRGDRTIWVGSLLVYSSEHLRSRCLGRRWT